MCGLRAPRPRCMPGTLPLASCRSCAAQRKNTIDQGAHKHGNPRRARHPSVMTAGVCSPSVPADHGAAFAGRVCRRVQAGTNGSPSRNHLLSHAAIAPRSTPRLAFDGVGFFRRSSMWHVLGQVARDGGLGHHRVKRVESPGGQDEDSLCTPREAAGGFTSEGPFCEGRPERNAPEGNQVVSRFRGVWIVATREPLDLAVAVCAAIASRVASDSSFCRTRPGHGCRRQAHHGHHQIVFLCAGFPVARREHPGTMRCWWWVCGRSLFSWFRRIAETRGCRPPLADHESCHIGPAPGPPNTMRKRCAQFVR